MKTTFIYFLKDPTDQNKGYVGKTDNPATRVPRHVTECRDKTHARANWLKSLAARGFKPTLEIVDEVSFDHWPQCEVAYIEFFLEQGFKLVNGTPGGEDPPHGSGEKNHFFGKKHAAAAIEKNRLAHLGKTLPASAKEKVSIFQRNKKKPNNTSGVVGVAFDKTRKKWTARLCIARRRIDLGRFDKFEDAVFVRRLAEDKYFA